MSEVMRYDLDVGDVESMAFMAPAEAGSYVESSDFDRVTAERDGLQLALNTADQTIDDLQIAIGRRNQRIDELTTQQAEAVDLLKYLKDEREYPDDFEKRLKAATQQ
jgi:predicted  nucleic acid-binding Zn-ribbon protein